ncbi:hypothetical protein Y032_0557g3401 [Ancylostoma ceylanicum]|uniref:Cullin N-terminal domain-containing protein n=1 Tax=Ancylostoma ceylanicum TaxID=53326 RepID=A0A016WR73_9BILA|nr:hypothetical protein Y032_0557g3401 [Ancylostoma ceylanicum]
MAAYALGPKSVDFDKVWGNLQPSVIEIMNLHPMTKKDWDDKFHDVYDICVAIPEPLSSRLYSSMKRCIEMHVKDLYEKIAAVPSDELLNQYFSMWKIYYKGTNYVHRLFGYLNNQFVKSKRSVEGDAYANYASFLQKPDVKEIGCLAMDIWKEHLIEPILDKLVSLLLAAIGQDRLGNVPSNKDVIAGVISSFLQIEEFEYSPNEPIALGVKLNYREPPREFYQEAFESRTHKFPSVFHAPVLLYLLFAIQYPTKCHSWLLISVFTNFSDLPQLTSCVSAALHRQIVANFANTCVGHRPDQTINCACRCSSGSDALDFDENRFLASTEEYYSGLAQRLLADLTCSKYMEAVIEALEAEERRSATYVSQSSVSKMRIALRTCFVHNIGEFSEKP